MSFRSTLRSALTSDRSTDPTDRSSGVAAALRRPAALLLPAVLLLALLAAGAVWTLNGKTVTLSVDDVVRTVDVRGETVADVLQAADLEVGEHDTIVPAPGTEVSDGDRVVLRRGRPLQLVVDGQPRTVWVTALSVDEALQQLDLRSDGLAVSASRSRRIPLEGLALDVRTPKPASVLVDGAHRPLTSAAATVGDLLAEAGVQLGPEDRVTPPVTEPVTAGLPVLVQRVRTDTAVADVPVPFGTERRDDANLAKGTTRTLQAGKNGVARRTTVTVLVDGAVESRTVTGEQQLAAPTSRVLAVGTKVAPPAPKAARAASAPAAAAPRQSTGSAGGLNWAALAKCESGGNPRAVSSTGKYRGMYQFSTATWRSVGGSGDPAAASVEEQTHRAQVLYNRSGRGQWPHCGRYL